jgi:SWI/SNF-related matrix-associated actin-dependent regulator of chromatin subfamily A member 5
MTDIYDLNDDSDVDMTGIDMDDDDVVEEEEEEEPSTDFVVPDQKVNENVGELEDDFAANELAAKEAAELEAVRMERLELIKAEQDAIKGNERDTADPQSRLEYLLHQSDVFAHFLAGSVAATNSKKKKGGKGKATSRGPQRMTEEEEDEQLLKSAQSERHAVVRLHHQPTILAPICTMHPYQLEGLNWMIKLHDHGINGILADGTIAGIRCVAVVIVVVAVVSLYVFCVNTLSHTCFIFISKPRCGNAQCDK